MSVSVTQLKEIRDTIKSEMLTTESIITMLSEMIEALTVSDDEKVNIETNYESDQELESNKSTNNQVDSDDVFNEELDDKDPLWLNLDAILSTLSPTRLPRKDVKGRSIREAVYQYDVKTGDIIAIHRNAGKAALSLHKEISNTGKYKSSAKVIAAEIRRVCKGRKSAYGYIWRYQRVSN